MAHVEISPFIFDCAVCRSRCDGKSKGNYNFENDAAFSEKFEQEIIARINASGKFQAKKSEEAGYPDIAIYDGGGKLVSYLEVKVQQRTFMAVRKHLPLSDLKPSETVALNLSDLLRYFAIQKKTGISTSIVWVLLCRPCITKDKNHRYFFQRIDQLQKIYAQAGNNRRFRRRSGEGDVVDGQHKGVTVNYHFSLKELKPWNPDMPAN